MALELAFADEALRALCEKRGRARKQLGIPAAALLAQRLADLDACATVAEFADLFLEDVMFLAPDRRAVRLTPECRIVFCSGHVNTPRTKAGAVDWGRVTRIKILSIGAPQ